MKSIKQELLKKPLSNLKWSKWHCICKVWEKDKLKNILNFEYSFFNNKKDIQIKNNTNNYYIRYKEYYG
jgi:hypothetical protein